MFQKCLSLQFLYSLFLWCAKPFCWSIMSRNPHRDPKRLSKKLDKVLRKKYKKDLKKIDEELRNFFGYKSDAQSLVYLSANIFHWTHIIVDQGMRRMASCYEYPSSIGYDEQYTIMKDSLQQPDENDSKDTYDDSNGTIKNTQWLLKSLSTPTRSGLHFNCSVDGHCDQSIDNTQGGESKDECKVQVVDPKPVDIDTMIFEEALMVRLQNPQIISSLKRKEINEGIAMINDLQDFIHYYTRNNK